MSQKLAGKVAVVTGASKGIGASIALHLAAEGAAVVVNYASSKEGADRVVRAIGQNGGKAIAVQANLAKQEAVKLFGDGGGSVVNISSVAATAAPPTTSVYSATKAAVDAVTHSLAKELGPRKIRVNSINPGMVETKGLHSAGISTGGFRSATEAQTPLGRIGQPQDIAPAVVFFASDDASWITGETLTISVGFR